MTDISGQAGNNSGVGQGNANQILQTLNSIAQSLKTIAAANTGNVVSSAGADSGKYEIVTLNGTTYAVKLYATS